MANKKLMLDIADLKHTFLDFDILIVHIFKHNHLKQFEMSFVIKPVEYPESISTTLFYECIFCQYFGAKKLQSQCFSFVIFGAKILYKICACKKLMKLTVVSLMRSEFLRTCINFFSPNLKCF